MTPNGRKWLSLNQVAEKLSVSRTMVNQYRERKDFPVPIQFDGGKKLAFVADEIEDWMAAREASRLGDRIGAGRIAA